MQGYWFMCQNPYPYVLVEVNYCLRQ